MRLGMGVVRAASMGCFVLVAAASAGCDLFDEGDSGPGPTLSRGVGDSCTVTDECRTTLACIAGSCRPSGLNPAGAICQLTGDCMPSLYCGPQRVCAAAGMSADGGACTTTADC